MSSSWNLSTSLPARLLLALGAGLFLSAAPSAQGPVKLATLVPEGSLWDKSFRRMGASWKRETGGRISLRIYAGGIAGDEPDLIRKMRIGQLHAAALTVGGLGDLDPAFRIFNVPLFFRSDAELEYVLEKMGPMFAKRLEEKGFVLVHWGHVGWLHFFSTEPINTYDDFKRLKHFVWGGDGRLASWYAERGLRTVPLSATDVLTGLQTGLVEVLPVSPTAALSLQWFRSAPNMLDVPIAPFLGATVFSKRAWARIKPGDRETILRIARATGDELFDVVPKQEALSLVEMQKRGLNITPFAGDEPRWNELAEFFREKLKTSSVPPHVFDAVTRHLEEFRAANGEEDG